MSKIIACNWKLNGNLERLKTYTNVLKASGQDLSNLIIFPPFAYIYPLKNALEGTNAQCGGQDLSIYTEGAFTGETGSLMLKDIGADYVLIGHSERRKYFCETDKIVKDKTEIAVIAGLMAIVCVGESLEERESGGYLDIILRQIEIVKTLNLQNIIIAYEPCWAIGTGLVPTTQDINEVVKFIKSKLEGVKVLYGGSVNASNATEILQIETVDGLLIGSASLDANSVLTILGLSNI
jgi:triosephosphate isomerase